ncbi:MAG: hypothetical protein HQ581_02530 [Planctomycetes bacterium]|nr:hypothetical protein [Planctomycetota bacterium]
MPDSQDNPVSNASPSHEARAGRLPVLSKFVLTALVALNLLALFGVLATQGFFRALFVADDMNLTFATNVALGPILPVMLGCLLPANVAVFLRIRSERYRSRWGYVVTTLIAMAVGYYVYGMLLPFLGATPRLA